MHWGAISDQPAVGCWTFTLPRTVSDAVAVASGKFTDILIVETFSGQKPAWPTN